jgi:hypothetical protein
VTEDKIFRFASKRVLRAFEQFERFYSILVVIEIPIKTFVETLSSTSAAIVPAFLQGVYHDLSFAWALENNVGPPPPRRPELPSPAGGEGSWSSPGPEEETSRPSRPAPRTPSLPSTPGGARDSPHRLVVSAASQHAACRYCSVLSRHTSVIEACAFLIALRTSSMMMMMIKSHLRTETAHWIWFVSYYNNALVTPNLRGIDS